MPSAPLETRSLRAFSTGKPVLLTAPVAESVFERRERLAVNSCGALVNDHFSASYLKETSGKLVG